MFKACSKFQFCVTIKETLSGCYDEIKFSCEKMISLVKEQKLYRVDHYGERDQEQEITNSRQQKGTYISKII